MSAPTKPWETQNVGILRSSNPNPVIPSSGSSILRNVPALPPRPNAMASTNYGSGYNSYMPYSGTYIYKIIIAKRIAMLLPLLGLGYSSYSSMPYSSLYNSYGSSYGGYGYNNYGNMYGMGGYNNFGRTDAEGR